MSLTRKTDRQARRFFNKTGSDIERAFSKRGPLAKVGYQIGGAFEKVGDDIVDAGRETLDGLKDAGNFLEKNASMIGTGIAAASVPLLMATGVGAPAALGIAGGLAAAGATAGQFGTDVKRVTSDVRRGANQAFADVKRGVNTVAADARREVNRFGADVRSVANQEAERMRTQMSQAQDALASTARAAETDSRNALAKATSNIRRDVNQSYSDGLSRYRAAYNSVA